MSNFNKNLDELIPLYGKKGNITRHLKKIIEKKFII